LTKKLPLAGDASTISVAVCRTSRPGSSSVVNVSVDVVYRIDTDDGKVDKVKVGREPHGLTVWPQPGRYSLGHTGNLR
jgi:hypothetical protein